ncbi:hypothetical protein EVAR_77733_1 [Eumeta japonica]|uniref:Histone-lysine N-methyltransferase SETMAR n=1 Tax=Eumeta variegata TaxID=151549 RepID=A0A4C1TBQ3_EUMVA|nr:hypothetical protein EVAR_77733_1 [Eumeta japonica]
MSRLVPSTLDQCGGQLVTVMADEVALSVPDFGHHVGSDDQGTLSIEILTHPPYSPDLAPCDFYSFLKIKEKLKESDLRMPRKQQLHTKRPSKRPLRASGQYFSQRKFATWITNSRVHGDCASAPGGDATAADVTAQRDSAAFDRYRKKRINLVGKERKGFIKYSLQAQITLNWPVKEREEETHGAVQMECFGNYFEMTVAAASGRPAVHSTCTPSGLFGFYPTTIFLFHIEGLGSRAPHVDLERIGDVGGRRRRCDNARGRRHTAPSKRGVCYALT